MPSVVFVLQREDGQVLVEQRPKTDRYYPEAWIFPGGKLEPGETAWRAMVREMDQELGVRPQLAYDLDLPDLYYGGNEGNPAFLLRAFLVRLWMPYHALPPCVLDTGAPLTWVPLTEMLATPHHPVQVVVEQVAAIALPEVSHV